jgi:TctA family transporter
VKLHRAITLVVMLLISVALVAALTVQGIQQWNGRSLVALAVVLVAAAIGGIAFSWKRYFGR